MIIDLTHIMMQKVFEGELNNEKITRTDQRAAYNYTELAPLGSYICVEHHYTYICCSQHKYTELAPLGSYICVERGLVSILQHIRQMDINYTT